MALIINRNDILYKEHVSINLFSDSIITRTHPLLSQNTLLQCLFTLVFETALPLLPFCTTAAAPGTWCYLKFNWTARFDGGKKSTHRTKKKKQSLHFRTACDHVWCEQPHMDLLFRFKRVIAQNICIKSLCSVWKGLHSHPGHGTNVTGPTRSGQDSNQHQSAWKLGTPTWVPKSSC